MLGIGLKVLSVMVLLSMASMAKGAGDVPPGQLVFFRSFFAIWPIVLFLAWRGELIEGFKTARPMAHLTRAMFGVTGMGLGFYALTKLPLPEAVAIGYAMPLMIVVLGAVMLKEHVRLYRWSAVAVGMLGVGIVMWPRLTVFNGGVGEISELALGALAGLGGATVGAFAAIHVRNLLTTERSATIVVYFSIMCSLAGLATLPFGWVMPTPGQAALMVGSGIAGGIGQIILTEAFRRADMSVLAPFEYTSLLLSLIVGYLVFGDVPTVTMLVGGLIVVAAGLFIIWRERQLGIERKARQYTPAPPA